MKLQYTMYSIMKLINNKMDAKFCEQRLDLLIEKHVGVTSKNFRQCGMTDAEV